VTEAERARSVKGSPSLVRLPWESLRWMRKRRTTGMEKEGRVLYIEGLAIHGGPEPCVGRSRGRRRSVGRGRAGWVIEPRNRKEDRGADAVHLSGRRRRQQRYRELLGGPARSESLGMYGGLHAENREVPWSPVLAGDAPSLVVRGVVGRWVAGREGNASAVSP
jgi:hypothetical protein